MTAKAIRALFWKEFRQQYLLCATLFLCSVMLQALVCMGIILYDMPQQNAADFGIVAMVFIVLYVIAATSIIFSNEHEERTYHFLRAIPVPKIAVFSGKIGWLFISTVGLVAAMVPVTLFWYFITGFTIDGEVAAGVLLGMVIVMTIGFCWGIFWTTLLKSQMLSFLLSIGGMIFQAWFLGMSISITRDWDRMGDFSLPFILFAITFACLPTTIAAILGLGKAWNWIGVRVNGPRYIVLKTGGTYLEARRNLEEPVRGEFRWLLWQTFRQSRGLIFTALGIGFGFYLWLLVDLFPNFFGFPSLVDFSQNQVGFIPRFIAFSWCAAGYFLPFILCGSIFAQDHKKNSIAMLVQRGVSPRKIWWSRILVFGTTYFCIPFLMCVTALIYCLFWVHSNAAHYNSIGALFSDSYLRDSFHHVAPYVVLLYATGYIGVFCLGAFASLHLRSGVVAVFSTAMLAFALMGWGGLCFYYFTFYPVWTMAPFLLAALVASRLRTANWLRGRNTFRAYALTTLSPVFLTFVVMLIVIPLVRIYSVPMISLGYPPIVSDGKLGMDSRGIGIYDVEIAKCVKAINDSADDVPAMKKHWEELQNLLRDPMQPSYFCCNGLVEANIYQSLQMKLKQEDVSLETVKEALTFLESIPKTRVPHSIIARRYYAAMNEDINRNLIRDDFTVLMKDEPWEYRPSPSYEAPKIYRFVFPWEKYRLKRLLNSRYQMDARWIEKHGVGQISKLDPEYSHLLKSEEKIQAIVGNKRNTARVSIPFIFWEQKISWSQQWREFNIRGNNASNEALCRYLKEQYEVKRKSLEE